MSNVVRLFKEPAVKPKTAKAAPKKPKTAGGIESANFTDALAKAWLRRPPATRQEYKDSTDPKLRARVSNGLVAFSLYAWDTATQKPKRWALGNVTSVTSPEYAVAQIRKEAARLKVKIGDGVDTAVEALAVDYDQIRSNAAKSTVAHLLAEYLDNKKIDGRSIAPATRALYERTLISTLGDAYTQPLAKLTPVRLSELCAARQRTSEHAAWQTSAIMSAICKRHKLPDVCLLMKDRGECKKKAAGRPSRLGVIHGQDIAAWAWNSAQNEPASLMGTCSAMLCVGLVTGWRRRTIRLMRWDWIDFDAATIAIPADANKGKRPYLLPLPPRLLALLAARREHIESALCFPTQRDRKQPADFESAFLNRLPRRMSPHDMRKAFSLALRVAKVSADATKILMMHSTRSDVGLHNYLLTVDPDELMDLLRESAAAVEAVVLKTVGDKATRKRLDAAAYERTIEARARARVHEKKSRDVHPKKRARK